MGKSCGNSLRFGSSLLFSRGLDRGGENCAVTQVSEERVREALQSSHFRSSHGKMSGWAFAVLRRGEEKICLKPMERLLLGQALDFEKGHAFEGDLYWSSSLMGEPLLVEDALGSWMSLWQTGLYGRNTMLPQGRAVSSVSLDEWAEETA